MKLIFLIFYFLLDCCCSSTNTNSPGVNTRKKSTYNIYFSRIFTAFYQKKVAQRLLENYTTGNYYTEILYACYVHKTTFLIVHVYYGYFYLFLDKRCQYRYTCSAEKSDDSIPVTL